MMSWAKFHHGASIALGFSKAAIMQMDSESLRTWIDYQGNDYQSYDHAGLIFGLGLQGLFNCFTASDIYYNLRICNDARIIATILGLACSLVPRQKFHMDDTVIKAFNLHLEFNYESSSQVSFSKFVQSASIAGLGLYLKGMAINSYSETLIKQILAPVINENNKGRECHSLSAGFALGLINLGKGTHHSSIKNMSIDERLFKYIEGGEYLSEEDLKNEYKSCNLKLIQNIDTQLTTPGALIALTLIHLKENNEIVSGRLKLPNTIHEINVCNPKNVLLTVVAKNLINWDSMQISKEFISNSMPDKIKFLQLASFAEIEKEFYLNHNFSRLDFHNLSLIYHNINTGTFLSLAFKYSGTGNQLLKSMMTEYIQTVLKTKILESPLYTSRYAKERIDEFSFFNILSVMGLALGILMAGRCDTESFKILKKIKYMLVKQKKINGAYGFNMAL